MSGPPPENLMEWAKGDLAKEVRRLRTIVYATAERSHGEARRKDDLQPTMWDESVMRQIGAKGSPFARGNITFDARGAVLMDMVDVFMVDTFQGGEEGGEPEIVVALKLEGRVNYSHDRSETLYLFDEDGAAAIVSQLIGLATRIGPEFAERLMARLEELPKP